MRFCPRACVMSLFLPDRWDYQGSPVGERWPTDVDNSRLNNGPTTGIKLNYLFARYSVIMNRTLHHGVGLTSKVEAVLDCK
ncbi:unnamed protein product [Nezara viridula]|uniref:Uncharacterized protein n=1 Tax=Nezara viridula TaxID=85310 RepID=A0A9P0ECY5_NEZVI|nr:unnamed protein product [Nezara viridula]